jgi:hypothetical protein
MTDAEVASIANDDVVERWYSRDVELYTCNAHVGEHGAYVGTEPCPECAEATGAKRLIEPEWMR